jgi:hypothetical protein
MSENNHVSTVIVGAGVAGLAAAKILYANNIRFLLVEAQDYVGGRVRSVHAQKYRKIRYHIARIHTNKSKIDFSHFITVWLVSFRYSYGWKTSFSLFLLVLLHFVFTGDTFYSLFVIYRSHYAVYFDSLVSQLFSHEHNFVCFPGISSYFIISLV